MSNPLMASTSPPVGIGGAAREQAIDEVVNAAAQGNAGSGDHANASTQDAQAPAGGHPSTAHIKVGTSNYADIDRQTAMRQMRDDPRDSSGSRTGARRAAQADDPARIRAALSGRS